MAYELAKNLSFPRRIDSEGHQEAINFLKTKFQDMNLPVQESSFTFTPIKYLKYIYRGINILVLMLTIFFYFTIPDWMGILVLSYLALFLYSYSFGFRLTNYIKRKDFTPTRQKAMQINAEKINQKQNNKQNDKKKKQNNIKHATNLYSIIPPTKEIHNVVILSAHYDSINVSMNPKGLLFYSFVTELGPILIPLLILINGCLNEPIFSIFRIIVVILAGITSLGFIYAMFITHGNESQGAVDNASGVAVAFETTNQLPPLQNTMIILAAWDAEEEGLYGSSYFVAKTLPTILQEYNLCKDQVHIFAFDGPGSKGKLGCSKSFGFPFIVKNDRGIVKDIKSAAKKLNIPLMGGIWFYYASSDHAPFALEGYDCTWFFSMTFVSNTVRDKPELLDSTTLNNAVQIAKEYVLHLDENGTDQIPDTK